MARTRSNTATATDPATATATAAVETVLITGSSSGIGEALAGCFAGAGLQRVLVARRAELLDRLAGRSAADGGHGQAGHPLR